jgi:hypothetical protein
MAGLDPKENVDARDKRGHDEIIHSTHALSCARNRPA